MLQAGNIFMLLLGAHPHVSDQFHLEKRHFLGYVQLGKISNVNFRSELTTSLCYFQLALGTIKDSTFFCFILAQGPIAYRCHRLAQPCWAGILIDIAGGIFYSGSLHFHDKEQRGEGVRELSGVQLPSLDGHSECAGLAVLLQVTWQPGTCLWDSCLGLSFSVVIGEWERERDHFPFLREMYLAIKNNRTYLHNLQMGEGKPWMKASSLLYLAIADNKLKLSTCCNLISDTKSVVWQTELNPQSLEKWTVE